MIEETILEALRPVVDPEIGISVVDLGMIREIVIGDLGEVEVKMVLTTPFCPLASTIVEAVQRATAGVSGVKSVKVTVLQEPWDPSWAKP